MEGEQQNVTAQDIGLRRAFFLGSDGRSCSLKAGIFLAK
jgi:hypothetical protein